MDRNMLRWSVDCAMGIAFLICLVTGLLKFTILLRITGLRHVILPSALISDIHDWSGIILMLFVFIHLYLNRRWIISVTHKMLTKTDPGP